LRNKSNYLEKKKDYHVIYRRETLRNYEKRIYPSGE